MAFPVAVQSAIFYIVACTPCMSARNRYRTKKNFDKERKKRAALELEEPQMYRHPSPFNMNPNWEEEVRMGPSLPKKGRSGRHQREKQQREQQEREKKQQNPSQRKLTSAGQDSEGAGGSSGQSRGGSSGSSGLLDAMSAAPIIPSAASPGRPKQSNSMSMDRKASGDNAGNSNSRAADGNTAAAAAATDTSHAPQPRQKTPASPTLVPEDDTHSIVQSMPNTSMSVLEATASTTAGSDTVSVGWNYKRYEREDEELWGTETSRTHKLMDAIAKASSSAGRFIESARLGTKELRMGSPPLGPGGSGSGLGINTVTDEDRANFYAPTVIHPPVNEYHPPVVSSKPAHKDGLRWMLQPPPPAKVMEGKVPVSRSTSVASSYAGPKTGSGSELSLTRRMAMEARLRRADSNNSGVTVTRPRPTSSAQRLYMSQHGGGAGGRSRSDSLASSIEEGVAMAHVSRGGGGGGGGSLSDDDGMLRPAWRHPATSGEHVGHSAGHHGTSAAVLETIKSSNDVTNENTIPEASKTGKTATAATPGAKTTVSSSSQDSGLGLSA